MILFAVGIVHFLGVGVVEFSNSASHVDFEATFVDLLYFCMVLVTTVGYGHELVPLTPSSRVFTVCFALVGLILFGAGTAIVTDGCGMFLRDKRGVGKRAFGSPERPKPKRAAEEPPSAYCICRDLLIMFTTFLAVNFSSAAIFFLLEDGWRFNDALYHCFMTATTIGPPNAQHALTHVNTNS